MLPISFIIWRLIYNLDGVASDVFSSQRLIKMPGGAAWWWMLWVNQPINQFRCLGCFWLMMVPNAAGRVWLPPSTLAAAAKPIYGGHAHRLPLRVENLTYRVSQPRVNHRPACDTNTYYIYVVWHNSLQVTIKTNLLAELKHQAPN